MVQEQRIFYFFKKKSGLLELAKVFSKYPPKKTIQLIWFSGEEQGYPLKTL
jgi:hypothetical protein